MDFQTSSPINIESLSGQNKKLFDFLKTGKPIHCLSAEAILLGIGRLNSRISDLKNKFGVSIEKKYIVVNQTTVVEYKLKQE